MSFISEKSKKIPGSMIREMFAMRLLKEKHVVVPGVPRPRPALGVRGCSARCGGREKTGRIV